MKKYGAIIVVLGLLSACSATGNGPYAPGVRKNATVADQLTVAHRLNNSGEYELAIDAFYRAAVDEGLSEDVLVGLGSANLGLGRLGQAEDLLRKAIKNDTASPVSYNNLGVVLMEKGETPEAEQMFRRAFALDNGESDAIRDNLRLSIAKIDDPEYDSTLEQDYKLVRYGSGEFLIRSIP